MIVESCQLKIVCNTMLINRKHDGKDMPDVHDGKRKYGAATRRFAAK